MLRGNKTGCRTEENCGFRLQRGKVVKSREVAVESERRVRSQSLLEKAEEECLNVQMGWLEDRENGRRKKMKHWKGHFHHGIGDSSGYALPMQHGHSVADAQDQ